MTLADGLRAGAIALVILLAALGLGHWVLRLLRLQERGVTWLWLAVTCGLGLLSVGTMLLGVAGLFYSALFAVLLAPAAAAGAWLLWRTRADWRQAARGWLAFSSFEWPFRVCAYLLLFISAGSVLWIVLTHALMPPHEWDEVAYHLALPKLYVQAHRVVYVPFIVHSNWPMNSEMLFSVSLMWGSDIAPHLLMLGAAILTVLGLLVVAHGYFDDRVGVVAVALFLSVTLVKRLAGTGLIDLGPGVYVLPALVALERWRQERRWSWLVLSGAYSGFAAGSKLMGGGFPILLGLLLLAGELRQRPRQLGLALRYGTVYGLAGLVVAGPWYLRSFLWTGNPIWPFAYNIIGGRNWDALGDEYYYKESLLEGYALFVPQTPVGLLQSFIYLLTRPAEMGGYAGGLGVVVPLGALGAGALVRRAPRLLWQSLLVCAGFYLMWFAFVSHQLRFLLPVVPLMALAAAYLFVWLYGKVHWRWLQAGLLMGLLVVAFLEWPWASEGERALLASRIPYLRGQMSRDAWLDTQIDVMPLFRYANTQLPAGARILLLPYEDRTYYLDRDYIWGNPMSQRVIPFERFSTAAELAVGLRRMGITHIIDNPTLVYEGLRYWQHDRALMLALRDQCGKPLYRQGGGILYALSDCTSAAGESIRQ